MMQTILVLPIGSAEAARGFSVMNHIKNKRRSRLTPAHMQDIMRFRLNGVDEQTFTFKKNNELFLEIKKNIAQL